ncbi:MAG TPA: NAD(P)/FAD-dependent oxidoreductase [Gammaproteobacteria bacterium]
MPHNDRFDVAVIGAGHNGLVCAFYLAKAGLDVVVFERAEIVGGAAITEEFAPGFRNSVASYTVSLLQKRIIDEMDLGSQGLEIVQRPMANYSLQPDGPGLEIHRDAAATAACIRRHSRADAERYPRFLSELARITRFLKSTMLEAPVAPGAGATEWWRTLRLATRAAVTLGPAHVRRFGDVLTQSAGHWLDGWFESPLLKGTLGFDAIVGNFASPYAPSSGYLLLHHALGETGGVAGAWGHAVGGMGSITQAMERAAAAQGVDIRVACPVSRIERRAGGFDVHTAEGAVVRAHQVAGAIHPQTLFLELLDPASLPDAFVERIGAWKSESASFRINVALSELPRFVGEAGEGARGRLGSGILISPSLEYLEAAHRDAVATGQSRQPVIETLIPSTIDASLAPEGRHVASLFCQHFARSPPGGPAWRDLRQHAIDRIIGTVDDYAPNFSRSILAVQAFSPEDLEARFGLIGGDIFHGRMTLDQLYWNRPARGYAQYRTPLEGVYLCASGAHPGGGVSGAPGRNAARALLEDRKRRATRRGR